MTQSKEVKWVRLGEFIEQLELRNRENSLCFDVVRGISVDKIFTPTKANLDGVSLSSYKVVPPKAFAYVPDTSRRGDKIALAFNDTEESFLISSIYTTFHISNISLLPSYLYIWFARPDFNRYARFNSWGSARETLDWVDFLDIKIPVPYKDGEPDVERQREVVEIWKGLRRLKEENEALAAPLLELCQAKMDELKHTSPMVQLGDYITIQEETNSSNRNLLVMGLNKYKVFMPTAANLDGVKTNKYLIVKSNMFAFSGMQTGRDICIRIAYNSTDKEFIISPAYTTFVVDESNLLPEFLYMWFQRKETDRLGWFLSDSSVRSNLDWPRFESIKVPKPSIEVQRAIVDIYHCARRAKEIAEEANQQLKTICPALMQHIIHS